MAGKDKISVSVYMSRDLHASMKACAESVNQSLSNFLVMAGAQRARNWAHPITGEKVVADVAVAQTKAKLTGWDCMHPACPGPADECRRPDLHRDRYWQKWDVNDVDPGTGAMQSYWSWDGKKRDCFGHELAGGRT